MRLVMRLGISEIFVVVVGNQVDRDLNVLTDSPSTIIIYKQWRQSVCCCHEIRLIQMHVST